jgi:beta-lactamase regulating signal transducer with metallopeptidase domain
MSTVAESYGRWLADYYLLASVLLALALASTAILKQPAQRLAIAKSTLVSLILLAVLCAIPGWSAIHLLTAELANPISESRRTVSTVRDVASEMMSGAELEPTPDNVPTVSLLLPARSPEPGEGRIARNSPWRGEGALVRISWSIAFVTIHSMGAACVAAWLLLGWLGALRLRRTAIPAPSTAIDILNKLIAANRDRPPRVELLTHHRLDVPVAFGVWRPAIVLPAHFIESAIRNPQSEIAPVLAHESAHILNHDLRWATLARSLLAALWANPLFWLTRRRLRLDQEALADAAAAEVTTRQQYAEQLVAWARNVSPCPALHLSSAVGLWEGPSQLRQRIAILLDEQLTVIRNCSRRWRVTAALALIAGATGLSLVTIQPSGSQAQATETENKAADTPATPATGTLTMRFEYDGVPPKPTETKEYVWPSLDGGVYRRIDTEKEVGATVFDESLVVGKDRGIANVFVWVRSKDIPNLSTAESVPKHSDPQL